jgi:hypothetical protein
VAPSDEGSGSGLCRSESSLFLFRCQHPVPSILPAPATSDLAATGTRDRCRFRRPTCVAVAGYWITASAFAATFMCQQQGVQRQFLRGSGAGNQHLFSLASNDPRLTLMVDSTALAAGQPRPKGAALPIILDLTVERLGSRLFPRVAARSSARPSLPDGSGPPLLSRGLRAEGGPGPAGGPRWGSPAKRSLFPPGQALVYPYAQRNTMPRGDSSQ